jgi:hypothetical protein
MSPQPARHLHPVEDEPKAPLVVVNTKTGEQVGSIDEHVQPLLDQIAGLQRDIQGWTMRHAELKRDKEGEAKESPVWPSALRVFDHWKKVCKHPKSVWTLDRFELIRPWLEKLGDKKKPEAERLAEAEALCILAVDGIAYDPFVTERKNGTKKRHDGWHLIFDSAERFEERCNAAPIERIREVVGQRTTKEAITGKRETAQQQLA